MDIENLGYNSDEEINETLFLASRIALSVQKEGIAH
jgi:hypothetical protein